MQSLIGKRIKSLIGEATVKEGDRGTITEFNERAEFPFVTKMDDGKDFEFLRDEFEVIDDKVYLLKKKILG